MPIVAFGILLTSECVDQSALVRLRNKALRSGFSQNMVQDMIALASSWKNRLHPPRAKNDANKIIWATSFPSLLKLTQKEKKTETRCNDYVQTTSNNWFAHHKL